ncbi:UNVERIFIED_CONTAM: mannose-6-phosphate isomerase-like protein (cupin superfamily) [Acetivibrio alkalicellulosi]
MIKKAEEMVKEIKEKMRGGKGSVELVHIFSQNEFKGKIRLCAKITIEPGSSIGFHQHADEEEMFYIIKGKGTFNDNGNIKELECGDSVLTGNGASHSVENTGEEDLEMLAVILLY